MSNNKTHFKNNRSDSFGEENSCFQHMENIWKPQYMTERLILILF